MKSKTVKAVAMLADARRKPGPRRRRGDCRRDDAAYVSPGIGTLILTWLSMLR